MGQDLGCEFKRDEGDDFAKKEQVNREQAIRERLLQERAERAESLLAARDAEPVQLQPPPSESDVSTLRSKPKKPPSHIAGKLSTSMEHEGCKCSQKDLAEFLESPSFTLMIIILIFVDLASTVVNDICENTNLINPVYDEEKEFIAKATHIICVTVLSIFFVEQLLHLVAFGAAFFRKFWFVMDFVIVCVSLTCETVLEDKAEDWLALLVVLRLWKVVAFIFDVCLAENEDSERDEKLDDVKMKKAAIYNHTGITGKLSASLEMPEGWQKNLGEFMESPHVTCVVIILILVDLTSTLINDICENTELVNPKYDEQKEAAAKITHTVCVTVLCIFFAEQLLHLVAFGAAFFTKFWFVMDLVIVSVSLVCETVLEDRAEDWLALFVVLRLWKVVAFVFDMCLTDIEDSEMDEKKYKPKAKSRNHTGITGKLSASHGTEGKRNELGEFMESPRVAGVVIVLIFVDLTCTLINDVCENTDLINPKYDEQKETAAKITHTVCVTVLCIFLAEQLLHLVAFGAAFFTKIWFVMDLVIVCISLPCETVLEDVAEDWLALLVVLRLWKVVAFIFDTCLAQNESHERNEKLYTDEEDA